MLEVIIPSQGESIIDVEIKTWFVSEGDYVEKDQIIAEIDSDKATLDLTAEESGIISLKIQEGEAAKVGDLVCVIDTKAKKQGKLKESQENQRSVKESQKEVSNKKDVTEKTEPVKIVEQDGVKREKLSLFRRSLSDRLVAAKNQTAMLTTFNEVNMKPVMDLRKKYGGRFLKKHETKLGFMSFFTKAVTRALKEYPDINAMIDGDYKVSYDYCNVGIAVSAPKGLMVPVLRDTEKMSFKTIEQTIGSLALKAREGQLTIDEMSQGTFTITNGGIFGSMLSTPIINTPQSAILGMHNIVERPMAVQGKVVILPMMYLALSYDHRIVDGKDSVSFLVSVKEAVEDPESLLMGDDVESSLDL